MNLVMAASHADEGVTVHTAVGCRRRPERRACGGHLIVVPFYEDDLVEYRCSECDREAGAIVDVGILDQLAETWEAVRPPRAERTVALEIDRIDYRHVCELSELHERVRGLLLSARTEGGRIELRLGEEEATIVATHLMAASATLGSGARADAALRIGCDLAGPEAETLLGEVELTELDRFEVESLDTLLDRPPASEEELRLRLSGRAADSWQREIAEHLETTPLPLGRELPLVTLLGEVGIDGISARLSALLLDREASPRARSVAMQAMASCDPGRLDGLAGQLDPEELEELAKAGLESLIASEPKLAGTRLEKLLSGTPAEEREARLEPWDEVRRAHGVPAHELFGELASCADAALRALAIARIVDEGSVAGRRFLERARNETADAGARRDLQGAYLRAGRGEEREAVTSRGDAWITTCDGSGAFTVFAHLRQGSRGQCIANLCLRVTGELRDGFVLRGAGRKDLERVLDELRGAGMAPVQVSLPIAAGLVRSARRSEAASLAPIPPEVEEALARVEAIEPEEPPSLEEASVPPFDRVLRLLEHEGLESWFFDRGDLAEAGLMDPDAPDDEEVLPVSFETASFRARLTAMTAYMARYFELAGDRRRSRMFAGLHAGLLESVADSPLTRVLLDRGLEAVAEMDELEDLELGALAIGDSRLRHDLRGQFFEAVEVPSGRDLAELDFAEVALQELDRAIGSLPQDRRPRNEERKEIAFAVAREFRAALFDRGEPPVDALRAFVQVRLALPEPDADGLGRSLGEALISFLTGVCEDCPVDCLRYPDESFAEEFYADGHPSEGPPQARGSNPRSPRGS